ncbi:response regulator [Acidisoma sp. C75]
MSTLVLVVEDEPPIRRLLRTVLEAEAYRVREAADGRAALAAVGDGVDLILLDLGLPDIDGLDLLGRIRKLSDAPVVILSSREDERGKVAALDLGADDYVTKPFGVGELAARLRTALRHRAAREGETAPFRHAGLVVDRVRRRVSVDGAEVHLTPREYDILDLLVAHAGRVLTHRFIMDRLWGASGDVQQLRVYVRQLRQKIERDPARPDHVLTETGIGYRLAEDP